MLIQILFRPTILDGFHDDHLKRFCHEDGNPMCIGELAPVVERSHVRCTGIDIRIFQCYFDYISRHEHYYFSFIPQNELMVYTFRNLLGLLESAIMLQTSTLEINV